MSYAPRRQLALLSALLLVCTIASLQPTMAQSPSTYRGIKAYDLSAQSQRVHQLTPEERIDVEKQLSLRAIRAFRHGQLIEYRVWSAALKRMRSARGVAVDLPRTRQPAYYRSYQPPHFNYQSKFSRRLPTINLNWRSTEGFGGLMK